MMRSTRRAWLIGVTLLAGCAEPTPPVAAPRTERPAVTIIQSPAIELEPEGGAAATAPAETTTAPAANSAEVAWQPLFDGAELGGWQKTSFGGAGDVTIEEGAIRIPMGADLAGVTFTGEFPTQAYELALDARRVDGNDFFCGLTFPVGDESCSLILGGWGGSIVGLSSIDGLDAANNGTTQAKAFEQGRWYAVRVKVTPAKIECWLDDEQIIDQPIENRRISVRDEVIPSKPLGIATYATVGEAKNIRFRKLPAVAADGEAIAP